MKNSKGAMEKKEIEGREKMEDRKKGRPKVKNLIRYIFKTFV